MKLVSKSHLLFVSVFVASLASQNAFARGFKAGGAVSITPYASISSTKAIKPSLDKSASDETVSQRTTYGLKVDVRLSKFFGLSVKGGTNVLDQTKKASAMRDEYGDIDFKADANVDTTSQDAEYTYKETQYLGDARAVFSPIHARWLNVYASAGVRARQRLIEINEVDAEGSTVTKIEAPIKYDPVASAGVKARLLGAFTANIEYSFFFRDFPKTEPHEQEVLIGFGMNL